jgi:hypothetical protein
MDKKSIIESIIEKISLCTNERMSGHTSTAVEQTFIVLAANGYPRWIIPTNNSIANHVLAQWRPYGRFSIIKWKIFQTLYALRIAHWIPSTEKIVVENLNFYSTEHKKTLIPIVYVGTLGNQQKAVVTLVDPDTKLPNSVMKVALADKAVDSVKVEADMLTVLKKLHFDNIPQLLLLDENCRYSLQSFISGTLSERTLTQAHVEFLIDLPSIDKSKTFRCVCELLKTEIAKKQSGQKYSEISFSEAQIEVCNQAVASIDHLDEFSLVLVHGDFVPWNLKVQRVGKIAGIDWEDAKIEGLPLWDLCHFYFMQEHLFNDFNAFNELTTNVFIVEYLNLLGISTHHTSRFILMYCVSVLCSVQGNVNNSYKAFLLEQVTKIVSR